jgi:hypothetical protein
VVGLTGSASVGCEPKSTRSVARLEHDAAANNCGRSGVQRLSQATCACLVFRRSCERGIHRFRAGLLISKVKRPRFRDRESTLCRNADAASRQPKVHSYGDPVSIYINRLRKSRSLHAFLLGLVGTDCAKGETRLVYVGNAGGPAGQNNDYR